MTSTQPFSARTTGTIPVSLRLRLHGVTWLAWRQNRLTYWLGGLAVMAFGIYAAVRHQSAVNDIARLHLSRCFLQPDGQSSCDGLLEFQQAHQYPLKSLMMVGTVFPLLFGVFLGAPLFAQEMESGTYRTACSQSVTRLRWFAIKLAVPAAMTVLLSGALAAGTTWCWQPVAKVAGGSYPRFGWNPFDAIGPLRVGLSLLLLVVGATIGLVTRRTVIAMGSTLATGLVLMWLLERFRGALWPAVTVVRADDLSPLGVSGGLSMGDGTVNAAGEHVPELWSCAGTSDYNNCLRNHGIVGRWAEFHPPSQLWPMQWSQTGMCLVLAALLTAFCGWHIRRHLT